MFYECHWKNVVRTFSVLWECGAVGNTDIMFSSCADVHEIMAWSKWGIVSQSVLFLSALIVWPICDLTAMRRRSTLTSEIGWFPDVSAWRDKLPSANNLALALGSSLILGSPSGTPISEPKNKHLSAHQGFLLLPCWRVRPPRGSFVVSETKQHTHLLTSWAYRKLSLAPNRFESGTPHCTCCGCQLLTNDTQIQRFQQTTSKGARLLIKAINYVTSSARPGSCV